MIQKYQDLANRLINAPLSSFKLTNIEKLSMINLYSKKLFGGKIRIPNVVVAGTKGKGSTCSVCDSVIQTSGLKTCLFTSPHLVTPRERMKINGIPITEKEYVDLYEELSLKLKDNQLPMPPFFAIHALMAGLLFHHKQADVGIIECGVGGRYDWTKIFDPTVAVITHLEYDHLETLGNTPYSISWHKFGICTENSKNLTVPQSKLFQKALDQLSEDANLRIRTVSPFWIGKTGILGPCHEENTALGVAAATELLKSMNKRNYDISKGARNASIHGRFQTINLDGIQWMLDGAHTAESIKYCTKWYESSHNNSENDILLCATTKTRDPNVLLAPLTQKKWKKILFVEWFNNMKMKGATGIRTLKEAIKIAKESKPHSILVTGSLHLVGDTLRDFGFDVQ